MKTPLDVSRGTPITFTANGVPIDGIIVGSEQTVGPWASISVETDASVPDGAQLLMPDLPETGGCGMAQPRQQLGRTTLVLSIGYNYIDLATIGK